MEKRFLLISGGRSGDLRKDHNEELLSRMTAGEALVTDCFENQWPKKPIIKKSHDIIKRLFGEDTDVQDGKKNKAV
jgi:hypothetical protein